MNSNKSNQNRSQAINITEIHCQSHGFKIKYYCLEQECLGKRRIACDECVAQIHKSHKMLLLKDLHAKLKTLHTYISKNNIVDDVDLIQKKILSNTQYLMQSMAVQLQAIENILLEKIQSKGTIRMPNVDNHFQWINPDSILTENSPQAAGFYDKAFTCLSDRQFIQEHFALRSLVPEIYNQVLKHLQNVETILTKSVNELQSTFHLQQKNRFYNDPPFDVKSFAGDVDYKLFGHSGAVNDIMQVDPQTLISCSEDSTVKVWDMQSKKCIQSLSNDRHRDGLWTLARWSSDIVISGGVDGQLAFWNWKKGEFLLDLSATHQGAVRHIIKLNDKQLLSCGSDRKVFLWDQLDYIDVFIQKGKEQIDNDGGSNERCGIVAKTFFHQKDVNSMLLLPIGVVLTFGEDQCAKMWDLEEGKCIRSLETEFVLVESVYLQLNSVAVSTSNGKIIIMDLPDLQITRQLNGHTSGFWIYGLIYIDSGIICSCSTSEDPNVILWQWRSSYIIRTLKSSSKRIMSASKYGGKSIATGDSDGTISIWK